MRYLILVLLFVLAAYFSFAQTEDTIGRSAVKRFIKFFNQRQADSILNLFTDADIAKRSHFYPKRSLDSMFEKQKKIVSYSYYNGMTYDYLGGSSTIDDYQILFTGSTLFLRMSFDDKTGKFDLFELTNKLPKSEER